MSSDAKRPTEDDDELQRLNRKLIELLNELRVALPGVQVLFAFLLIVPFSQGFGKMSAFQEAVYAGALIGSVVASILLIAPSAYHRHRWRPLEREALPDKEEMLAVQHRFIMGGMAVLAATVTAVIVLVFDVLYGVRTAMLIGAGIAVCFGSCWYGIPLFFRARHRQRDTA